MIKSISETAVTDLSSIIAAKAKIAAEEVTLVRAALRHAGQKGSELEQTVISLLRTHLPGRLGVSEGIVVTSEGYASPQLDLIIYDRLSAQILYEGADTKAIPIEYVFAVGEVKTKLDQGGFRRFADIQRELKQQRKFLMDDSRWTYHAYGADWIAPPIASFLFGFEGDFAAIHQRYVDQHASEPINLCIDAVVCLENFVLYRSSEYGADLYSGRNFALNGVRKETLFFFLGLLAKASTEWFLRQTPQIYRYYSGVRGVPDSLVTTGRFLPPVHTDLKSE
jgi:hypothetical protein